MNERAVAAGLVGVLTIGLVAFFFSAYKKETYERFIPPTGEARANPVLGAQRLLELLGYDVVSRSEFAPTLEPPATSDTVVVTFNYERMEESQLDELMRWVAAGGHLVVEAQPYLSYDYDPLLTAVGVTTILRRPQNHDGQDRVNRNSVVAEAVYPWDQTANAERDLWGNINDDNLISLDFGTNELVYAVHDQFGIFAGQLAYEKGRLTVVADLGIVQNLRISEEDHAFMLTRLVGTTADAGRVWLFYGSKFPGLWSLLVERVGYVLIAAGVLLALCLWWAAQRFGPPIAPPQDVRKAFIDHVEASGRFLWRHKQGARLLVSTQQAFLRDARTRHPTLRRFNDDERDQYLARICGVPQAQASACLQPLQSRAHADFTSQIQTLKTMWTRL